MSGRCDVDCCGDAGGDRQDKSRSNSVKTSKMEVSITGSSTIRIVSSSLSSSLYDAAVEVSGIMVIGFVIVSVRDSAALRAAQSSHPFIHESCMYTYIVWADMLCPFSLSQDVAKKGWEGEKLGGCGSRKEMWLRDEGRTKWRGACWGAQCTQSPIHGVLGLGLFHDRNLESR